MWPALLTGLSSAPRPQAAARDPGVDGLAAAGGAVDDSLFTALAVAHGDRAVVVVVEQQRDGLAAAQAAAVEQGEHGRVAGAAGLVAAGLEQATYLADVGQGAGADVADIDHAGEGLGIDQARGARLP